MTARGTVRTGSRTSSARFDTVSIPVYAIIATGIESAKFDHVGATSEVDVRLEDVPARGRGSQPIPTSSSCVAKSSDREDDVDPRRLLDADDVHDDENDDHGDPDDAMSHGFCRSGSQKMER